ncbi:conserved hypothetical protein [Allochromatium warmingii]|uniref:TIGR02001 family outer membrane protein n=1 Tax=Allochromatium warmingii TaxID=61595 RepID=A0A1H3EJY0_ALLWA|nr:TorF family putative porin [Allochromatium warmingii]SDX78907.1 conserved hypothetical protein [Allochromatium warmingii]
MNTPRISATAAAGLLVMGTQFSPLAVAEGPHSVSANIGVVSNYIWRGVTQTDNAPAIQGGLDYAHESGFSLGTWVSNVDFGTKGYELDVYAGFDGSITDDLGYALKVGYYAYPEDEHDNFDLADFDVSLSYKWLTIGTSYTFYGQADDAPGAVDGEALFIEGDWYYYASLDFELPYNLGLSLRGGYYDFDYDIGGVDYAHWGLSISREAGDFGTVSFNYDQIGRDTYDTDPKVWIGWNKDF